MDFSDVKIFKYIDSQNGVDFLTDSRIINNSKFDPNNLNFLSFLQKLQISF